MKTLRELATAALPGPWHATYYDCKEKGKVLWSVATSIGPLVSAHNHWAGHNLDVDRKTGDYIAACSPDAILALLDERDALCIKLARIEAFVANDAQAIAYQTLGQYRSAILKLGVQG